MSAKWLLQSWWIRLLTTFLQDFDAVAGIPCLVVFSPAVHLLYFCFNNTHEGPTQQQFPNYFNLPLIVLRRFPNWILSIKNDSSLKQDWALEFKVQLLTQTPGMQDWCLFFFFYWPTSLGWIVCPNPNMLKAHQQNPPKQKYSQQENWAKSPSSTTEANKL